MFQSCSQTVETPKRHGTYKHVSTILEKTLTDNSVTILSISTKIGMHVAYDKGYLKQQSASQITKTSQR